MKFSEEEKAMFARSAEQLRADENQRLLFAPEAGPAEEPGEPGREDTTPVKPHERKKAGRKPLDPKLPRADKTIDIPEHEKTYACEGTGDEDKPAVRIAPVEPSTIPKSIVSPGLLSCVIIQKFEDHLPYYRQEKQFERILVTVSRQDMSNWQQQAYQKLAPLFALLKDAAKSGPVVRMDETPVQVMGEEGRGDTQKSYMWLARGGSEGKTVVWYEYRETRASCHVKTFLAGYTGYLQTDGYEGYDAAVKDMPGVIHAGCFAHARRYFFEAAKVTGQSPSAEEGVKHIKKLYTIEGELRNQNLNDETFLAERKARAGPVLEGFKAWLVKQREEVPPSLLLGKAVAYSLSQWDKLVKYLESPHLTTVFAKTRYGLL